MYTILIVDDEERLRKMVRRLLESQGHKVMEAATGEEAIQIFRNSTPDMAVLDVNLGPGMSGFEVCRNIRKDPYGVSIPIIFLTGEDSETDLLQGFQEGADDYIRKPFSLPEFIARVTSQLTRIKRQSTRITKMGECQFKPGTQIEGESGEKYQILFRMTSGGMGVIFRGFRLSDYLQVVIKTLNSSFLENYKDIQRFLREANATINLKHPNIAEGLEVVRSPDYCFFVMKYVEGDSLASILEERQFIPAQEALHIVRQIAEGLEVFYENNLVHRDIKPGNILVHNNRAVLVDMGLTKPANSEPDLTTEGVILGTPYYLSPEQALGEPLDIRSDIYSLGATFYHAVTGLVPFRGSSTIAIINARFIQDPDAPIHLAPELTPEVSALIQKMMARYPRERYQNPKETIEAIDAIANA
ncbi:MAG: protein kinase [Planctomycetes bacterium]|nr:protein kinase [Planctomycetota bacterium]HPY74646.1 protein kinase [Planctomycetota bacterium]HQB00358.1 protein kinase [Planctomycetota bacterium]